MAQVLGLSDATCRPTWLSQTLYTSTEGTTAVTYLRHTAQEALP